MTYRSRPVFDFVSDWSSTQTKSFSYDLREILTGYGASRLNPTSPWMVRGWEMSLLLDNVADCLAWEQFFDAAKGRLKGFWYPEPTAAALVVSGSGTSMVARYSDLQVGDDVWLANGVGAPVCRRITAAAVSGDETTWTLDSALPSAADPFWSCQRLLYVRFAGDDDKAEVIGEGLERRTVRVVELPAEYATAESGTRPVVLYRFFADFDGTVVSWRYTSFLDAITSNSQVFAPQAINHGAIRRAGRADREEVQITTWYAPGTPWARLFPNSLGRPLWVEISECDLAAPNDATVIFTGRVQRPEFSGRTVTLRCASWLDALATQIPRADIAPRCNWQLFGVGCGLDRTIYRVTATISAMSGNELTITAAGLAGRAAHWFAGGYLDVGTGDQLETRTVLSSTAASGNDVTVRLNLPLSLATVGASVRIHPGCDKTAETCAVKYSNFVNWGGFRHVPASNLSVKAVEIDSTGGNKK